MGRRHGDEETRQNRTRSYPGGYDRRGDQRRGPPERSFYGPYHDARGNRFYEDEYGTRFYDDDYPVTYDRDYERDRRQSRGSTATKGLVIVAVALVVLVGMILVTNDVTGGPSESAQQAPQEQGSQQPVQPQQPAQPQAPAAPSAPQQDGASSEQVEGMRADIDRQLAEIRQSINELRLEIWSFFGSEQQEQENSP